MQRSEQAGLDPVPGPAVSPRPERWPDRPGFGDNRIFINDLEFTCALSEDGSVMDGELHGADVVRAEGSDRVRPSVLATIADVMAGIQANHIIGGRLPLTVDIDVRTTAPAGEWIGVASRILKVGRSTVAAEVRFDDLGTGKEVALSFLTFMPSPRPQDVAPSVTTAATTRGSMSRPFPEHVGARLVGPGVVEIDHRPFVTQASRTVQGGIVALLGEYAAESLTGRPVVDLDTRYLAAVRVGPARATALDLGAGQVRVEVRDSGNEGRLAARCLARVTPEPKDDPAGGRSPREEQP